MILNNLQEVSDHLRSLIFEMSEIHNKLINPIEAKQHNAKHSILIKLPKLILLTRITPFLTLKDIQMLSNACVAMRKTIYGPIGFKLISFTHTPYPIAVKQITCEQEEKRFGKMISENQENMMDYEDEKFLKRERAKFKQILMGLFEKYNQRKEEYEQTTKKLKIEKTQVSRLKSQEDYFSSIKKQLQHQNMAYKSELKLISEGFTDKIKNLDEDYDDLIRERTKLQNQKQALVGKVREYQNQIENIRGQSDKSKRNSQKNKELPALQRAMMTKICLK